MGPYFILKGLRMINGPSIDAYGKDAQDWLRRYSVGAHALANYLEKLSTAGELTVRLSESQSPEVLRQKAQTVEDYVWILTAGKG
jgi:hypothetical protein